MNLVTEYVSRPNIAINLFKMPSSIVAVCDVENENDTLKPVVLTFSSINSEEVMIRKYMVSSGESPTLVKEKIILLKNLFSAEALDTIAGGCRMLPYSFDQYPADVLYNDPPQSVIQENNVIKYFQSVHNSLKHQEYRRMIVWCDFITQNASKSFLLDYGEPIQTNKFFYVSSSNVEKYDKKNWIKWLSLCERFNLTASSYWANEILFAKCIPRMNKKDVAIMRVPNSEDVAA